MMKKMISLILISALLTSCGVFRTHKMDVEQGNIITKAELNSLHPGLSETDVRAMLGNPVLANIFTNERLIYVYTLQQGYGNIQEISVTLIFMRGILQTIQIG